jgi:hypothetical protein
MITYERLLSFGNVIPLSIHCDPNKLLTEIATFSKERYNAYKLDNPRYGLSVTSLDGSLNGTDLNSLYEVFQHEHKLYDEMSFKTPTEVVRKSAETQKLIMPWLPNLGRSHFLFFKKGGYFPPHRDDRGSETQHTFRIVVPLAGCNPPSFYYIFDGQVQYLTHGYAYFMNTNLTHSVFSYTDNAVMLILNVECTQDTYHTVLDNMLCR